MPRNLIRARKANSSVLKVRSRRRVLSLLGEVLSNITCYYGCVCCDTGRCDCW